MSTKSDFVPNSDSSLLAIVRAWIGNRSINIFGPPFAGKDIHGEWLSRQLGAKLIGGGELLRQVLDELPADVLAHMNAGGLVPTAVFEEHAVPHLQVARPEVPLVLTAFGRMDGEQEMVIQALHDSGHPLGLAISMRVSDEEILRRFHETQADGGRQGGRADDTEASLVNRIESFRRQTLPVIAAYRDLGYLVEISGVGDIKIVRSRIMRALADRAEQK